MSTRITDDSGTRWVEIPLPKRRKSPRALRFAAIEVGCQLVNTYKNYDNRRVKWYYLVTDLWFDPVAGQSDQIAGQMVAIAKIKNDGTVSDRKESHTKRGLASQGFHYADIDYLLMTRARNEAANVVGIGMGNTIRKRPKMTFRPL